MWDVEEVHADDRGSFCEEVYGRNGTGPRVGGLGRGDLVVLRCLGGLWKWPLEVASGRHCWEVIQALLALKGVCWPGVLDQCPHCSRRTNDGADGSDGVGEDGGQELQVWRCWVGGQDQRASWGVRPWWVAGLVSMWLGIWGHNFSKIASLPPPPTPVVWTERHREGHMVNSKASFR